MKNRIIFILTGIILLLACNPDKKCKLPQQIIGTGEIVTNALVNQPLIQGDMSQKEHVIRSDSENMYHLQVSFDNGNTYTDIDFNQYTLLGKYASGACRVIFERNVSKNLEQKQIVYIISVLQCGICKTNWESMNWVLVPKIPDNYEVVFEVKENQRK
jgi:hypothetical protein